MISDRKLFRIVGRLLKRTSAWRIIDAAHVAQVARRHRIRSIACGDVVVSAYAPMCGQCGTFMARLRQVNNNEFSAIYEYRCEAA